MATTTTVPAGPRMEEQSGKRDFRQEVTDRIVGMLEKGVAPWQKPWDPGADSLGMPTNPTTAKAYRGGNAIHLMATGLVRGYGDPRWMTYRQAAEQGWQVRGGEKGTQIEFWEVKPGRDQTEGDDGQRAGDERDQGSRLIHRVYTVFNARQVVGVPAWTPRQHTPFEVVQSAEQILKNSGAHISHDQADRAFYDRSSDSIHLPPRNAFKDATGYYGTALHELAHWTGHPSRLDRATLNETYRFGDTNYAKEELRAELASVFLAAERGIPHDPEQHAAYVGSWIKSLKEDKHEIFRAAHDASKATDFLLALERDKSIADEALPSVAESLRAAHAITTQRMGKSARTVPALTDSGAYRGVIIGESASHILQRQTAQAAVAHPKQMLDRQPGIGENVAVNYSGGKATVRETRDRVRDQGLSR